MTGTPEVGALGHMQLGMCWFRLAEVGMFPGYFFFVKNVEMKLTDVKESQHFSPPSFSTAPVPDTQHATHIRLFVKVH